jgi:hypothetical protein
MMEEELNLKISISKGKMKYEWVCCSEIKKKMNWNKQKHNWNNLKLKMNGNNYKIFSDILKIIEVNYNVYVYT